MNDIDFAYAVQLPPEKAIEYLKSKNFTFSFRWEDVAAQAHAKAFTVAGAMKLDILSTIRNQVQTALDNGQTFAQFKKNLTPELQKLGWWGKEVEVVNPETGEVRNTRVDGHRLRTIYQTNIQSAYMAGRYQSQMEDNYRPYLQYVAILDRRTRPTHAALNDTILKKDDPFWETNYPPNGWRCRCRVRARSQSQVDRLGLKVIDGDKIRPVADKAFNSNPGLNSVPLDVVAWQKAEKVSESARNAWISDMIRPEQRQQILDAFVDSVAEKMQNRGMVRTVGYLDVELFTKVQAENNLLSPILTLSDKQLLHSIRNGKNEPELIKQMLDFISKPDNVYQKDDELLFVKKRADGQLYKMSFKAQKRNKSIKHKELNFITAGVFDPGQISNEGYKKIR